MFVSWEGRSGHHMTMICSHARQNIVILLLTVISGFTVKALFGVNGGDGFEMDLLDQTKGNDLLRMKLVKGSPFIAGRLGAAEACLVTQLIYSTGFKRREMKTCNKPHYNSGIYPETDDGYREFASLYIESLKGLTEGDMMASFDNIRDMERPILGGRNITIVDHFALMPFMFKQPWSQSLRNKTVLIVHPFKASIEYQLRRSGELFADKKVLPKFRGVKFVKMPQALAGLTPHGSYKETLEFIYGEIEAAHPFDVALVSAGAYAMPIALRVKENHNATAIVMGGAGQLLFGIKGSRWTERPKFSHYMNYGNAWMFPLMEDTPENFTTIENGGPYWARPNKKSKLKNNGTSLPKTTNRKGKQIQPEPKIEVTS